MGLNTYAKSLPYFTLKPREKKATSDVTIIISKTIDILAAYIWTGYDQGSQYEAGVRVWFEPSASGYAMRLVKRDLRRKAILQGTKPNDRKAWRRSIAIGEFFGASIMLGGTYLHKHNTGVPANLSGTGTAYQNDFYPLQQLRDIKPLHAPAGSMIVIDRDIFNIDPKKTFNAWDVELVMIVQELAVLTILRRALRKALCKAAQAITVRIIRTLGYHRNL